MFAAVDEREHSALHHLPLPHHHAVGQPHDEVPLLHELEVAATVALELRPGVECLAVELDDEPVTDEHVDMTNPGDVQPGCGVALVGSAAPPG